MNNTQISVFSQGNGALRDKDYAQAIRYYLQAIENNLTLTKIISQNIAYARKKYSAQRKQAAQQQIAVCGWELSHNAAGRLYTLAKLYQSFTKVEIIGSIFPQYGTQIWEPIRSTDIAIHHFTVNDQSQFIQQAIQLVAAHPYDCVHLSKPRMPNIIIGMLYKLIWDAKVLVDIDDEELDFVGADTAISVADYLKTHASLPELKALDGLDWTRLAVGLVNEFDGITVSNPALQQRYGGEIIRHARDEKRYQPSAELKRQSREKFGIAQDKKVVLFCGTPREHKGLIETAQAIAALKRDDVVFAIVGDFPNLKLKDTLQAIAGVDYKFIANQPFEHIAEVVAVGDICVLLQDPNSPVAQFQVPAKLSDALGMGLVVLAEQSPALADLAQKQAIISCNKANLGQTLQDLFNDPAKTQQIAIQAYEVFKAESSYSINAARLQKSLHEKTRKNTQVLTPLINQWPQLRILTGQVPVPQAGKANTVATSSLAQRLQSLNNTLIDWNKLAQATRQQDLVSIIIPVYNQAELTTACIKAVYQHTLINHCEVIIVDNGSDTSTQKALTELQQSFKTLKVIRQQENLNFALGSNLGFAASQGANVVFLNNDTEVTANWLEPIIAPLAKPEIVAVQPKLLYPDGTIQCVGVVFSDKSTLGYPVYAGMKPEGDLAKQSRKYQAVTGVCMALRAVDFIQAKGFDPIYINGQEDIDLCLRLTLKSKRSCWYAAAAVVVHHESKTEGRGKYNKENRGLFVKRWKGRIQPDAEKNYKIDSFEIIEWAVDSEDNLKQGIAVFRPKIQQGKTLIKTIDIQNKVFKAQEISEELIWMRSNEFHSQSEAMALEVEGTVLGFLPDLGSHLLVKKVISFNHVLHVFCVLHRKESKKIIRYVKKNIPLFENAQIAINPVTINVALTDFLGDNISVVDAWFITDFDLRLRIEAIDNRSFNEYPCVIRAYQFDLRQGKLSINTEVPVFSEGPVFVDLSLLNPFMPLLLVATTAQGILLGSTLIPFPSLCRGGMHYGELPVMGGRVHYITNLTRLSNHLLTEYLGLPENGRPLSIAKVVIDTQGATSAEKIFSAPIKEWLKCIMGLTLESLTIKSLVINDVTQYLDETLNAPVNGLEQPLIDNELKVFNLRRENDLILLLPARALPTISALVSRRLFLPENEASMIGSFIVSDFVTGHPKTVALLPSWGDSLSAFQFPQEPLCFPLLQRNAASHGLFNNILPDQSLDVPLGIFYQDVSSQRHEASLLFPVAPDYSGSVLSCILDKKAKNEVDISVLVCVSSAKNMAVLIRTLAQQTIAEKVELIVVIENINLNEDVSNSLNEFFPSRFNILNVEKSNQVIYINEAAQQAKGQYFLIITDSTLLHDVRSLEVLYLMMQGRQVATSGCVILSETTNKKGKQIGFHSGGIFPCISNTQSLQSLTFHEPNTLIAFPKATYPVVGNSCQLILVKGSAWKQLGGFDTVNFTDHYAYLDFCLRAIDTGFMHLCTSVVTATSLSNDLVEYHSDIKSTGILDFLYTKKILSSATVIKEI